MINTRSITEPPSQGFRQNLDPVEAPDSLVVTARAAALPTPEQERALALTVASTDKTSWTPMYKFLFAAAAKVVMISGTGYLVGGGETRSAKDLAIGVTLVGTGFTGVIAAGLIFGADAAKVDTFWGNCLKGAAISATAVAASGYCVGQYAVDHQKMLAERLSILPILVGTAVTCLSIPNFYGYSEMVHGRVPLPHRDAARQLFSAIGVATLFGWAATRENQQWYTNLAVLSLALTSTIFGLSLATSDNLRRAALVPLAAQLPR